MSNMWVGVTKLSLSEYFGLVFKIWGKLKGIWKWSTLWKKEEVQEIESMFIGQRKCT